MGNFSRYLTLGNGVLNYYFNISKFENITFKEDKKNPDFVTCP